MPLSGFTIYRACSSNFESNFRLQRRNEDFDFPSPSSHDTSLNREPSPELVRISPLVTRPPKAKPASEFKLFSLSFLYFTELYFIIYFQKSLKSNFRILSNFRKLSKLSNSRDFRLPRRSLPAADAATTPAELQLPDSVQLQSAAHGPRRLSFLSCDVPAAAGLFAARGAPTPPLPAAGPASHLHSSPKPRRAARRGVEHFAEQGVVRCEYLRLRRWPL